MVVYYEEKYSIKLLPTLVLLIGSFFWTKKYGILTFFLAILVGDFIIVNLGDFRIGLYFHSFSFLVLSYLSWGFFKKKIKKEIIKYFIVFLILFLVIFFFSIEDKGDAYIAIFIYGLAISLVTSLLFTNYLKMMIPANYMLFLAIATRIISDSILTIVLFNTYTVYYAVAAHVIYFISNYLFFKGFLLKNCKYNSD